MRHLDRLEVMGVMEWVEASSIRLREIDPDLEEDAAAMMGPRLR
jgi:hypothetical protein